ncbi:MAG: spore coat protein [Bacillota bacterium]|nr:hypothetical protein [Bacillota bacterium]
MTHDRSNTRMSDQDLLQDCLDTLKHLSACYRHAATECDSQDLREVFWNILHDKLELQAATFRFMNQREWYKPNRAPQEEVEQLYRHFEPQYQAILSFYQ